MPDSQDRSYTIERMIRCRLFGHRWSRWQSWGRQAYNFGAAANPTFKECLRCGKRVEI